MLKDIFRTVQRVGLILAGALLMVSAVLVLIRSNVHLGHILTFLLGALLAFYGICLHSLIPKLPKWIRYLFLIGVTVAILFAAFLLLYGTADTVTYNEDAVIVLGAGIHGEELTENLKNRLDRALAYYDKNPDAVFVVSGGQGPQEDIAESLAMERYLLSKGMPQSSIIQESNATGTYENFAYSKQLLDNYFNGSYTVTFITNDYHIYRAGGMAKAAGLENATHCHNATPWYMTVPNCLRECFAVVKFWIFEQ